MRNTIWKLNWNAICGIFAAACSAALMAVLITSTARTPATISHPEAYSTPAAAPQQIVPKPQAGSSYHPLVLGRNTGLPVMPVHGTYGRPVDIPGVTIPYGEPTVSANYSQPVLSTQESAFSQSNAGEYEQPSAVTTEPSQPGSQDETTSSSPNYEAQYQTPDPNQSN